MALLSSGCVAAGVGAGVVGAGVIGLAVAGGSVSEVDKSEKVFAVEKAIYAIEKEGGTVIDISFADGYVKGEVGDYSVNIKVSVQENNDVVVSVNARKYLVSDSDFAEKILNNYKSYKR